MILKWNFMTMYFSASSSLILQVWEASTNLRFRRTHSPSVADIKLDFYSGIHGSDEPVRTFTEAPKPIENLLDKLEVDYFIKTTFFKSVSSLTDAGVFQRTLSSPVMAAMSTSTRQNTGSTRRRSSMRLSAANNFYRCVRLIYVHRKSLISCISWSFSAFNMYFKCNCSGRDD